MTDKISWHKFVRHDQVPAWEALGWVVTQPDLGPVHGYWSVLMAYQGEGAPIEPSPACPLDRAHKVGLIALLNSRARRDGSERDAHHAVALADVARGSGSGQFYDWPRAVDAALMGEILDDEPA